MSFTDQQKMAVVHALRKRDGSSLPINELEEVIAEDRARGMQHGRRVCCGGLDAIDGDPDHDS